MQTMQLFLLFAVATVGSLGVDAADFEEYATQPIAAPEVPAAAAAETTGAAAIPIDAAVDAADFDLGAIPVQPSLNIEPCSKSSQQRNECIKGLFQQIVPNLKVGLPEYNMPSIDPYFYKRGIFRYTNDGVQGGLLIKNMHIHGISDLQVKNFLSNFTDSGFIVKLNIEILRLKAGGTFKADVKFGGLRLVPKGVFNITIDNVKANILTDGFIETTDLGQQRLQLKRLNANLSIGDARIAANGIFSDRNLNTMILNLVNENLPEITRVGIPATKEQWAPILVEHINGFFANVPIDRLLVQ